jgi:MFS family permease
VTRTTAGGAAGAGGARLFSGQFVLLTVAATLYFLALGVLLPVVPRYVERRLGGGSVAVGVAVGAFAVGAVLLRPFAGRLGDRLGRRVLVIGGALVVAATTLAYLAATSLPAFVLARFAGGVGEAAFFVGAGTMVADLAPPDRRGEAISYWSVAVYGGLGFGPLIGERTLTAGGYGWVWVVAAGLALASATLGVATVDTLTARIHPTGPPPPLLHRRGLLPGVVLFLGMCGLAAFVAFVPLYVDDLGLGRADGVFLLYGGLILAIRILGARLPDRLGPQWAGTAALALGGAGMLLLAGVASTGGLFAGTIVFALGMSLLYPSMLTLALVGVAEQQRASVVGTVSAFFDLSQGLGAAMLGGVAALAGYRGAFAGGAVAAAAGLALLWAGVDPRLRGLRTPARAWEELPEPEPGT